MIPSRLGSNIMSKVVLLKYVPDFRPNGVARNLQQKAPYNSSAVVVSTSAAGDLLEIQGYPPIARKEKLKCWNIFKQALRDLLGIPSTEVISIRFAYPPYDAINTMSAVLQEPSHVVELVISKLANASHNLIQAKTTNAENHHHIDPYCRLRKSHPTTVRSKCNLAEMNRLLSQLTEVSLSLERTQQECDQIARRCKPTETEQTDATTPACQQNSSIFSDDAKIERLICAAESVAKRCSGNRNRASVASYQYQSVLKPAGSSPTLHQQRPDPPTDVYVRPSFSGGAYVMWNPVSLSASDENRGHRVVGYKVYVNSHCPPETVEGCLSSQTELLGLEHGHQYSIQVCTHTELCDSDLSTPVVYRHKVKIHQKSRPDSLLHCTAVDQKHQHKVELWLKNGHNLKRRGKTSNHTTFDATCHELSAEQLPSPHVHFNDGKITIAEVTSITSGLLEDHPSCKDDEDTRSTSSSHTSGIVTDYVSTPKLSPAFEYNRSSCPSSPSHQSNSAFGTMRSEADCSHLPSQDHDGSVFKDGAVTPSTLCASSHLSMYTLDDGTTDTVINEPLTFKPSSDNFSYTSAVKRNPHSVSKGPAPPQNFRVRSLPRAGCVTVSWTPVRRDLKGCSNGFYVLGYRIYINGSYQQSVDGGMTHQATVLVPPSADLQPRRMEIHVRTRSIAGESLPSNTVLYDLLLQRVLESRTKTKTLDSVLSGTDCGSLDPAESVSSHNTTVPASKYLRLPTRSRLETCI